MAVAPRNQPPQRERLTLDLNITVRSESNPEVLQLLRQLVVQGESNMATLADVQADVEQQTSVTSSAVTLLGSLAQMLRDAATDPAAINQIASDLEANNQALADAVAANTPGSTAGSTDTGTPPTG